MYCELDAPFLPMIVRRVVPCLRQASSGIARRHIGSYGRVQRRYSSGGPSAPAAQTQSSSAAPIASITNELDRLSPRFDVPADAIEILRTPAEFYANLKVMKWPSQYCMITN